MVNVQLAREWTDGAGASHAAGEMVDVDAVTLAELEAGGVVASAEKPAADDPEPAAWPGPTSPPPPDDDVPPAPWPGPTSPEPTPQPEAWPGPTGADGRI